jgi:hypothetical protein
LSTAAHHRRLPPLGHRLLQMRQRHLVPSSGQVWISVASWRHVNRRREDCLILPPGELPEAFDWRVVAGLPVMLVVHERDLEIADRLALEIAPWCRGCAALVLPSFGERVGWRLYRSFFAEAEYAA